MMNVNRTCLAALASLLAASAGAQQLACEKSFAFRADVDGVAGNTLCVSRASTFQDAARNFTLSNSAYTLTSGALVQGRFSDVNVIMSYARNSNTFDYNFVELGASGSFTGATRSESQDQFVDFVKKSDIIGRLMKYQAQHSATSPIAGVGGVIPMAGANDFSSSFDTLSKVSPGAPQGSGSSNNQIGVGLSYGSYSISGSSDRVTTTSLPLSYTVRNDIDPRRQLVFSLPLTKTSIGDADSYHGGLGVSYRVPMSDNWTLTPGGKYSVVASRERATLASVLSASLMSTWLVPMANFDLAIGNMLGYYRTAKFSSGDYAFNPDVNLTMLRNGILLSTPTSMFGSKMALEYSLIDTRYLGSKPFISNSQELGITLGTNRNATNARTYSRAGLSWLHAKESNGFNLNFGYWF